MKPNNLENIKKIYKVDSDHIINLNKSNLLN